MPTGSVFPRARESCSPANSNPVRACGCPCVSRPCISCEASTQPEVAAATQPPSPSTTRCPSQRNSKSLQEDARQERRGAQGHRANVKKIIGWQEDESLVIPVHTACWENNETPFIFIIIDFEQIEYSGHMEGDLNLFSNNVVNETTYII